MDSRAIAEKRQVGLFVTCLVDIYRPSVGFSAIELLEKANCQVHVPESQTCCAQPAYNAGDQKSARHLAQQVITQFSEFDYVVAPSGSCASMLKKHYPDLFQQDPAWLLKAEKLAEKTYELMSFLVDICHMDQSDQISACVASHQTVTYHDSCSGLRDLSIKQQPRSFLHKSAKISLTELPSSETCCGFGGAFCVKYPDISNKMVTEKSEDIEKTGADLLLAGDMGCLLNMAGKLKRQGSDIQVRHIAEILSEEAMSHPAIGEDV